MACSPLHESFRRAGGQASARWKSTASSWPIPRSSPTSAGTSSGFDRGSGRWFSTLLPGDEIRPRLSRSYYEKRPPLEFPEPNPGKASTSRCRSALEGRKVRNSKARDSSITHLSNFMNLSRFLHPPVMDQNSLFAQLLPHTEVCLALPVLSVSTSVFDGYRKEGRYWGG